MRINGSIIGSVVTSSASSAIGIWGLQNVELANRLNIWPAQIVTSGLVLFLDASNIDSYPGTGTTWKDLSGNNNNGTLTNGPTFSSANGGSIVFDGTNDNVKLGNASTFLPTSAITMNCWAKTNVTGVYKKLFVTVTAGGGPANTTGIYWSLGSSPYLYYVGVITNNGTVGVLSTATISTSLYTNFCFTYDGSTIKLYLNASLLGSAAHTGTINNSGIGRISGYDNNNESWNGNISTFSIYNRALTATEVLQNYNSTKSRFGL